MKGFYLFILALGLSWLPDTDVSAQPLTDSLVIGDPVVKVKKGSIFAGRPGKSMLLSLIIPGTGQIYNKSYLRVPVVYGAVGAMGYLLHTNTVSYKCRRDAYIASVDNVPYIPYHKKCDDALLLITDGPRLKSLRDQANANRQLSIIGFSLVWLANGIDAFVDAHLKDFDIDENLTFEVGTKFENDPHVPMRVGIFVHF
jgi:hypothetical protein